MVDAVDAALHLPRVQPRKARVGHDLDIVEMLIVGDRIAVLLSAWVLRLDILIERSAKRHIDQLQTTADAEDRFAHLLECLDHGQVVQIAHAVTKPRILERLLTIAAGPDIRTTMHHHTVEPFGVVAERDIAKRRLARGAGHHHHHGSSRHDPVRDRLLDILQRLVGEQRAVGVGVRETGGQTNFQTVI